MVSFLARSALTQESTFVSGGSWLPQSQRVNTATGNVHYDLFVVNREQKLVGVLNLRDFIQASPEARLDAIMNKQFVKLKSGASLEHAVSAADIGKVNSFPVVDKNDNLLGVLSTEILYEAIGRADPKRDKRDSVETVVALGELYWVTLSALFFRPHHQSQDIHKPTPETSDGR